jgi:hypothetical protein
MWHVFNRRAEAVFSPRFTINPPRSHHQKTTFNDLLFPNPPSKTPAKTRESHAVASAGFFTKNEAKHSA